jgi:non-canonical (house-cleaning) NTP pyrophosphatase
MKIFVISKNVYKKDAVENIFSNRYCNMKHEVCLIPSIHPSLQYFEEEIEHQAYLRIQQFLHNSEYLKKPDDVIVSIQTGLVKRDDEYDEITFVMLYCLNKIYCLESKRIKIPKIYDPMIHDAQMDRNKIFEIYDQIGFENRRKEVIEETLTELLQKIFD